MNKKNFIKVNVSNTFTFKSRCKYCSSEPKHYYCSRTGSSWKDYRIILFINAWIASNHKRMCQNYYLEEMPKNFTSGNSFGHPLDYKGYNPRYHKNHKMHNIYANENVIDHLSCQCGRTSWAFNESTSENRPEIKQRKARFKIKISY